MFINTAAIDGAIDLENKILPNINWKDQPIFIRVQTHISSEPSLEYNQDQTSLDV